MNFYSGQPPYCELTALSLKVSSPFLDLGLDFSEWVEKSDSYLNNPKGGLAFTFAIAIFQMKRIFLDAWSMILHMYFTQLHGYVEVDLQIGQNIKKKKPIMDEINFISPKA